jgi:hypothetical protein
VHVTRRHLCRSVFGDASDQWLALHFLYI